MLDFSCPYMNILGQTTVKNDRTRSYITGSNSEYVRSLTDVVRAIHQQLPIFLLTGKLGKLTYLSFKLHGQILKLVHWTLKFLVYSWHNRKPKLSFEQQLLMMRNNLTRINVHVRYDSADWVWCRPTFNWAIVEDVMRFTFEVVFVCFNGLILYLFSVVISFTQKEKHSAKERL
jgi:hypothetical protein